MIQLMPEIDQTGPDEQVFSVSSLNRQARFLLENTFPAIRVEGEISNLATPASGHLYFSLKDSKAQISCALFKSRSQRLRFKPTEGIQVIVKGRISLYEPRGNFQLIADSMEEVGDGALQKEFEALKRRLEKEGLFNPAHKQPIPAFPKTIGVITSPTGAAIRDILTVLNRRFPATSVIIYPTLVQGIQAAEQIADAINLADQRKECDVLLLSRGGGSLEDLFSFNEEVVARAVYNCQLPVVSAIGHEIDFVISDFVADQRCPTPSAAAELLSPDAADWAQNIRNIKQRLVALLTQSFNGQKNALATLQHRLQQQHPGRILQQQLQRLDELEQRLRLAIKNTLRTRHASLRQLHATLLQQTPAHRLKQSSQLHQELVTRLGKSMLHRLDYFKQQLLLLTRSLNMISPLATLDRGYSITLAAGDGHVLHHTNKLSIGDLIETRLANGKITSKITGKNRA